MNLTEMSEPTSNKTFELFRSTILSWVEDPGVDEYNGLDMNKLRMDEAYVVVNTSLKNLGLYAVSDDCYKCPFQLQHPLEDNSEPLVVKADHPSTWRVMRSHVQTVISTKNKTGMICELRPNVGEFGVYRLDVSSEECAFTTDREPVNIYLPLLLALLLLCGLCLVCASIRLARRYWHKTGILKYGDEVLAKERLRSIDTMRGIIIVSMIFVNMGGGGYARYISHATWNGLNFADVIAPAFVWIMGLCIPLSVKSVFSRGVPRWKALTQIFKRSCILFLIGVSLNSVTGRNDLERLRVMGILQRLALSYLVVASWYLLTTRKYFSHPRGACGQALRDVWSAGWSWLLAGAALSLHTFLMLSLHHPDCPPGYLGPGGRHNNGAVGAQCAGGAAGLLDRLVLTEQRLYSAGNVYSDQPFDPENLLGTLTTIVQTVLGLQAGATLLQYKGGQARTARWAAWAGALALGGGCLAGFSRERGLVPLNKNLWSISFVMVTSAISGVLLSVCYLLNDAWRLWDGAPFHAPGRNAIFLYTAHELCYQMFPFVWTVQYSRTHAVLLLEHVWGTALWVVVAHIMAKKKIFITI